MVTKHQLDKLEQRVEEVAERLGLAQRTVYVVLLHFRGESDEEFYARYPGQRGRKSDVVLSFGDPMDMVDEFRTRSVN